MKNAKDTADHRNRYAQQKMRATQHEEEWSCEAPPEAVGPKCNDGECEHCEYGPKEE